MNPPSTKHKKKPKFAIDLELDDDSSSPSPDDYSDLHNGTEDELDENHPLLFINITDIYSGANIPDVEITDTEDPFKNTELVIKFSHAIHPKALNWFIGKILAKKSDGGAELLLSREPYYGLKEEALVFHITASCWRQLEVAEQLELKKMDYSRDPAIPREFKIRELGKFLTGNMQNHDILTPAERQLCILHELTHMHALPGETSIPGYSKAKEKMVTGQSIFHLFKSAKFISSYFPLHNKEDLKKLEGKWFWEFFDNMPYEGIRSYFGERTCLYFNFVGYYSLIMLIPALILGLLASFKGIFAIVATICNMLAVTIFLILWQRYQSRITFTWGTYRMSVWEEPRAGYHGALGLDPVTGRIQYHYPYYKTLLKTLFVSFPIILVCCVISIAGLFGYIDWENAVKGRPVPPAQDTWLGLGLSAKINAAVPSIVYGVSICVANYFYRRLANTLTEFENHRTERQFEKHLVWKMVAFETVNNFSLFFYTAFVLRDMELLQWRLFVFLAIVEVFTLFLEMAVYFGTNTVENLLRSKRKRSRKHSSNGTLLNQRQPSFGSVPGQEVKILPEDDPRVEMSKVEEKLFPYNYEADFDDYLFLFLQFGYICLFSFVYPLAALIALLCNLLLLWSNLYKRREIYQRAFATRVSNIGAWQYAFEFMAVFAVMTNCALIAINPSLRQKFENWTDVQWFVLFVVIEHICIGVHSCLKILISKVPNRIRLTMAALKYQSWEALKREQARSTRRRLTRVFRPINDHIIAEQKAEEKSLRSRGNPTTGQKGNSTAKENYGGQANHTNAKKKTK